MLKIHTHTTPANDFRFKEDVLPQPFVAPTWNWLVNDVAKFRKAMGGDLAVGWQDRLMDSACRQNNWPCIEVAQPVTDGPLQIEGRQRWAELHGFANAYDGDAQAAKQWLESWLNRIPQYGGCRCRENFARIYTALPPDLSSRESFVKWGEVVHDFTNRHTGKPLWNAEQFNASPARNV